MSAAGGPFDFVLSMQAVHELRHKRHAGGLYARVRTLLASEATVLVCDHLPGSDRTPGHEPLYMAEDEHVAALVSAGFHRAECVWQAHRMALYRATE